MQLLLLTAALVVSLQAPGGGQPYEALDAGDVFIATITRVEDAGATNAKPPRVWLEVQEVLRGEPKIARSPALWNPPFHGIDWGGAEQELKKWGATPLRGPKVGAKYILGGQAIPREPDAKKDAAKLDAPVYSLFGFVQIPFSELARQRALANLAALDAARRTEAERRAAELRERDTRRQAWRAALTPAVIDRRTQQADAVAIATIVSSHTYLVEQMLKGEPRTSAGGSYYLTLPAEGYDRRIADIVFERPRVLLFLSEGRLIAGVSDLEAALIDPYEGICLADEASIAAVNASLARRPPGKGKPLVVISSFPRDAAAPLAAALRGDYVVVESRQFSAHGDHVFAHLRKTIPGVNYVVTLDAGPPRHIVATRMTADGTTKLYEADWPEKIGERQIDELSRNIK